MTFYIAAASADHIHQISDIWHRGWHDAHDGIVPDALRRLRTEESFLTRAKNRVQHTLVAISDEGVIGFAMTQQDELNQMYVSEQARGTGVARALIDAAEAHLREAGYACAWLACAMGNERAMRFYKKCGWINQGRRPVEVDTQDGPFTLDVWRYEKRVG